MSRPCPLNSTCVVPFSKFDPLMEMVPGDTFTTVEAGARLVILGRVAGDEAVICKISGVVVMISLAIVVRTVMLAKPGF